MFSEGMAKSFGSINSYREESIEDVADLEEGKRKNPLFFVVIVEVAR